MCAGALLWWGKFRVGGSLKDEVHRYQMTRKDIYDESNVEVPPNVRNNGEGSCVLRRLMMNWATICRALSDDTALTSIRPMQLRIRQGQGTERISGRARGIDGEKSQTCTSTVRTE